MTRVRMKMSMRNDEEMLRGGGKACVTLKELNMMTGITKNRVGALGEHREGAESSRYHRITDGVNARLEGGWGGGEKNKSQRNVHKVRFTTDDEAGA